MPTKRYTDVIASFERGMVGGRDPLMIGRNAVSFSLNATVRGGFIRCRPPFFKRKINYAEGIEDAVQRGVFQGACYYRPESGPQAIIAQISGRLFRFDIAGNEFNCTEISIPQGPNPESGTQAWLWQADKWVIVNDGASLPIFYDGSTSRRSEGDSRVVGVISGASPSAPPAIGGIVTLDFASVPFTGKADMPVIINGQYYQPISNAAGYLVELKAIYAPEAQPAGSEVLAQPSIAGYTTAPRERSEVRASVPDGLWAETLDLTVPFPHPVGTLVSVVGAEQDTVGNVFRNGRSIVWRVIGVSGKRIALRNNGSLYSGSAARVGYKYPTRTYVTVLLPLGPNVSYGVTSTPIPVMAENETFQVRLSKKYTGQDGQVVFINGSQYTIKRASELPLNPAQVVFINLSDDSTADYMAQESDQNVYSVPELPPGRMGAYGMGQNWVSLTDGTSFIVSDISRGPSGTEAEGRRDSVLKTVESTFAGGRFSIPTPGDVITSMLFAPKLDASLGQGPVQIGTTGGVFSAAAPVDYVQLVENATQTPILPEIYRGGGPLGHHSTIVVNGDVFFRSRDGIVSLVLARRDFGTWGNAPISDEVDDRVLSKDDPKLLEYGSACFFGNRVLFTCGPAASPGGVIHRGMVALNTSPASSLGEKSSPVYDGLWTGLNVLRLVSGEFGGQHRQFCISFNTSLARLEIWEIGRDGSGFFDDGYIPIVWGFESAAIFGPSVKPLSEAVEVIDGEISLDDVVGNVNVRVWIRAEGGCWVLWRDVSVCADRSGAPGSFSRIGLGRPPSSCGPGQSGDVGRWFQVKMLFAGHCRFVRAKFVAVPSDEPEFATPHE